MGPVKKSGKTAVLGDVWSERGKVLKEKERQKCREYS
jgi:hypothetical protein